MSILKNDGGRMIVITLMMACILVPIAVVMTAINEQVFGWNVVLSALAFLLAPYLWGVCKNNKLRYPVKQYFGHLGVLVGMLGIAILAYLFITILLPFVR